MSAGDEEATVLGNSNGELCISRRNLLVGEKVEVTSVEEGFLCSWRSGTMVASEKQHRRVKYDHLQRHGDTDHLVDVVDIPKSLDGLSCKCTHSSGICHGRIRPVPPKLEAGEWNLPYGQCVDVFSSGAWREGVLFDHKDGYRYRRVFFPDAGDEMNVDLLSLRITQDWDELRGTWKPRGSWLFLDLIDKYVEENYLPVSVKQLWCDIRDKIDFKRIGAWTCSTRQLWKNLVLKVIDDNLRITMNHFLLGSEHTSKLTSGTNKRPRSDILVSSDDSIQVSSPQEQHVPCFSKLECQRLHACIPGRKLDVSSGDFSCSNSINAGQNTRHFKQCGDWQRFDSVAEFCPQAVSDYVGKSSQSTAIDVRKHLTYMGWITEHLTDEGGRHRFCYISPDGTQREHSLRQVCLQLMKCYKASSPPVTGKSPSLPYDKIVLNSPNRREGYVLALPASHSNVTHNDGMRMSAETVLKCQTHGKSKVIERESSNIYLREATATSRKNFEDKVKLKMKARGFRRLKNKWKRNHTDHRYNSNKKGAISGLRNSKRNVRHGTPLSVLLEPRNRTSCCRGKSQVLRSRKRVQREITRNSIHQSPRSVLSWLIDNNVVLPRANISYRENIDWPIIKQGKVTGEGIKCSCCRNIFTMSSFEAHAGGISCRPAANIFLDDGRSLLDCQVEAYKMRKMAQPCEVLKREWPQGENDNVCSVCLYGGELILCDQCPSSFHANCLGLEDVPDGDWFCPSCCCGTCGEISLKDAGIYTKLDKLLSCKQCEIKYHISCLPDHDVNDSSETYVEANWFCSKDCATIFRNLVELTGKQRELGVGNLTWSLVKSMEQEARGLGASDVETMAENHCKLSVALDVLHELFEPVKDPRSLGDLAEDVIFSRGSELIRLNFSGFYTVLLERNDELVTVANVRIFGKRVAEIPLIGTRVKHRQLGMCRFLMNELEKVLAGLGVEKLVLPAVPSMLNTWINSFGFTTMNDCERKNFLQFTFLEFGGTILCQKLLKQNNLAYPNPNTAAIREPLHDNFGRENNSASDDISEITQAGQHFEETSITQEPQGGVETHKESLLGEKRFLKCYRRRKASVCC